MSRPIIEQMIKFAAKCKSCGDLGPEAWSFEVANRTARDRGWTDKCPLCRHFEDRRDKREAKR